MSKNIQITIVAGDMDRLAAIKDGRVQVEEQVPEAVPAAGRLVVAGDAAPPPHDDAPVDDRRVRRRERREVRQALSGKKEGVARGL